METIDYHCENKKILYKINLLIFAYFCKWTHLSKIVTYDSFEPIFQFYPLDWIWTDLRYPQYDFLSLEWLGDTS